MSKQTPVGGVQNAEQRFITMAEVATLLEQEKSRAPKERFYPRRPPYPLRVLSKPYPKRYKPWAFAQYDGRKGSVVEHVSKGEVKGGGIKSRDESASWILLLNSPFRVITISIGE